MELRVASAQERGANSGGFSSECSPPCHGRVSNIAPVKEWKPRLTPTRRSECRESCRSYRLTTSACHPPPSCESLVPVPATITELHERRDCGQLVHRLRAGHT